jgi:hypothetical protein
MNTARHNHQCRCCGFPISDTENTYYSGRCEQCTQADHDRVQKWLQGGADTELDERFAAANPSVSETRIMQNSLGRSGPYTLVIGNKTIN